MPDHAHNVLILGGKEHQSQSKSLADALAAAQIKAVVSDDLSAIKNLAGGKVDCVVLLANGDSIDATSAGALASFVDKGGGLVAVHAAAQVARTGSPLNELLGARIAPAGSIPGPIFEYKISVADAELPIVHRVQDFRIVDQMPVVEVLNGGKTFLTAWWSGKASPIAVWRGQGKGKVVYLGNGHDAESLNNPTWRKIFVRSVRFTAGEDWLTKTVKVAAIGYGGAFNMGKLHLESCKRARLTPVSVCELDEKRLETAKAELGQHIQTFTKVDDLLAKSDAEMCIVITPHNTHAPLSIQCLNADRHVVTEKPYTITVDESTQVIETARKHHKMATVFHNRRWDGDFMTIKSIINSGVIGDVFHIECFFGNYGEPHAGWWRAYKDISGGAFFDWGAHFVDWILNLMPHKIESVSGDFKKIKWHQVSNEDFTSAYVRFAGGRSAYIEQGAINAIGKSRWRILGTEGGIEQKGWDAEDGLRVVSHKLGHATDSIVPIMKDDWDGFYRNVADHLLLDEPLAVTPESARKVIAVLSLAEESSKRGGAPVTMPFEQ